MKFSQVIILLAATLAIVLLGTVSAGKEEPEDLCKSLDSEEKCYSCCSRTEGFKSGILIPKHKIGSITVGQKCKCLTYDRYLYTGRETTLKGVISGFRR